MNDTSPVVWIVCFFGALIPLVLLGGTSVAVWRRLARTYPDLPFTPEATFSAISGHIGGTYCDAYFRVDVGLPGLRISTWSLLRRLLPSFAIPWSHITSCTPTRHYFSSVGARIELVGWPLPLYFWPRGWRDEKFPTLIQTAWHERTTNVA